MKLSDLSARLSDAHEEFRAAYHLRYTAPFTNFCVALAVGYWSRARNPLEQVRNGPAATDVYDRSAAVGGLLTSMWP
jgi:hypothetical protein